MTSQETFVPQKCPYRKVCEFACPGDEDGEELWVPMAGFMLQEDGVYCIDWEVLIPSEKAKTVVVEMRDPNTVNKSRESQRAAQKKYFKTEKGRAARKRHAETGKPAIANQKYYYSTKGELGRLRRRAEEELFKAYKIWMKKPENAGKSIDDFVAEQIQHNADRGQT